MYHRCRNLASFRHAPYWIVVDSVSEVINIKGSDIEDTPAFGTALDTEYILGMAKMGGGVKILLDIDRVLTTDEVLMLEVA